MIGFPKPQNTINWVWAVSTPIVSLFISIFLTMSSILDFATRLVIVVLVLGVWFTVLLLAYVLDMQKKQIALLKEASEGDGMVQEWSYNLKINADGSAVVHRKIRGINFAQRRRSFVFESWTDPERDPAAEEVLKQARTMNVDVTVSPKSKPEYQIFSAHVVTPNEGHRVNRIVHRIPLVDPPNIPAVQYLGPDDEFIIGFTENHEPNTWKATGDDYRHRISHHTEVMHVEITFPDNWHFPRGTTDSSVVGYYKTPTAGDWEETDVQPQIKRGKVVWKIVHPRLLHWYRLHYSAMEVTPTRHTP